MAKNSIDYELKELRKIRRGLLKMLCDDRNEDKLTDRTLRVAANYYDALINRFSTEAVKAHLSQIAEIPIGEYLANFCGNFSDPNCYAVSMELIPLAAVSNRELLQASREYNTNSQF